MIRSFTASFHAALAVRWRYAGTIELISATDVARGRFEPAEFLDFISGRIARAYISSGADLDRRLAELDLRPDPAIVSTNSFVGPIHGSKRLQG